MKFKFFHTIIFCVGFISLQAQMFVNGDTLYGNEWINYDQNYVKIAVIEDGIHRLSYQDLADAGVYSGGNAPQGMNFQLYTYGQEIPIHVSTNGTLGNNDYIDFHGLKNKGELDRHLYLQPEFHLNPINSIFTDTSAYFLTWNTSSSNLRFDQVAYDPSNLPPAENYCLDTEILEYHNQWQKGERHGASDARECAYDNVEGFTASVVVSKTVNLTTPNVYASGPPSTIETQFITEAGPHDITIDVEGSNYINESFTNWAVKKYAFDIPSSSITGNSPSVVIAGNNSADDKVGVAYVKIEYPRTFDFGNETTFSFALEADNNNKKYIQVNDFDHGGTAPVLYDLTNNLRIATTLSGSTVLAVLPPSSSKRSLVLVSNADYKTATTLEAMTFIDFAEEGSNYVIVSNEILYDNGSGVNYVENYANYRRSAAGGNFTVTLAEVHQIYDQYAYGVNRHEMSLKNFVHALINAGNIEYLFLIGDGRSYNGMRNSFSNDFRIPTFGHPTSDHMIASDIGGYVPKIPVGRLAAHTPFHVDLYLRKVMAFEGNANLPQTIEDKAWMKRVVHLGGGDAGIQDLIRGKLEEARQLIEEGTFGGKVHSFFKTSSDVVQDAPSEQIDYLINDGVTMVTFFGHSAPSTLDFNLEDPSYYQNEGKYPLVYAIGCNNNRIMEYNGTLGEDWVLTEDKGAIAFFGATWQTTLSNLSAYAGYFYQNFSTDNYGESIGNIIVATINDFNLSEAFYANQLKQVMILHGDPALKMNTHQGPDLLVDNSSVSISPALLNTQMEDFDFNFTVANIGSNVPDSLDISIYHEMPDGQIDSVTIIRHATPGYDTSFVINIPLSSGNNIVGFNKLLIQVDPRDSISEMPNPLGEMNNDYAYPFYVIANDAFPVYPYEYSIVNTPTPTLKASTANAFASSQRYFFEIDTTEYFDSPLKQATSMVEEGGLLEWQPAIPYMDSTVYYWRVSVDSTETTGFGFNWHETSFVYIDNSSPGWNQSHFHQLKKDNKLEGVVLGEPNRKFQFNEQINEIVMKNAPLPLTTIYDVGPIFNGGTVQRLFGCTNSGVHVVVFDPATLEAWSNPNGGLHDSYNCTGQEMFSFPYKTNNLTEREYLINFLENVVPDDSYVAIFSVQKTLNAVGYYFPEDWALDSVSNTYQTNIFQVLENQGATKVRQLEDLGSVPYFFLYQKNNPDFLVGQNYTTEVVADTIAANIQGTYYIAIPQTEGKVTSDKIGPARAWTSLHWYQSNYIDGIDKTALKIYGVDMAENKTLLHDNIWVYDTTLSHIDAQQFPFLQLEYVVKDSLQMSAANLDFWRVNYQPVPEAALRPDLKFAFDGDTIKQGEQLMIEIAVENISEVDMDSLLVHYTVIDQNNNTVLNDDRMAPLISGDTLNAYLSFDTRNISTPNNLLIVDVNPINDQLEQTHFNNVAVKQFFVETDLRNPLIDVTFDGVHIMDGDIVSAKPLINISLNDENKYLALNDTSLFRVSLKHPDENDYRDIVFDNETVTFIPANEEDLDDGNKAKIEIRDFFQIDGIYELRVSAKDRSGNDAGEFDYKIRFEVINEAKISNVLNYPNPFSTSTQFVFTLTGSEVPDFMKIQIMTVSGKIVKEITQDELGMIHVGNNMSEYRWDGTDEYGDRLANGVYLYKVVTKKFGGESYEKYNTNTNQYFKNGVGKLVIMR